MPQVLRVLPWEIRCARPGQRSRYTLSQDSVDEAKAWIAFKNEEEMIDASRLEIEEELMELCTGGGTVDNEGGGSSIEVEVESNVETTGVGKPDDSAVRR